jgi:hypothetical protein
MNFFVKKSDFSYLKHNAVNTKKVILGLLPTFLIWMNSSEYLGVFYVAIL